MELNREHFCDYILELSTWIDSTIGRSSVVVPETIDAMRQLILQDRHVSYREIETTLGIIGTSIHSILNI